MEQQLMITTDKETPIQTTLDQKIKKAIHAFRAFEPQEGYWLAFSGGKDSIVIKRLADMAGVKYTAHYSVTTVDPPELMRYILDHHPDVVWDYPVDSNGKRISMWTLIASHTIPPTRQSRYCCSALKEKSGGGMVTVTGVRWEESPRRREAHGLVDFKTKPKSTLKKANALGVMYRINKHGGVVLNDDNDESRRMVEQCFRTRKTLFNPIVDWTKDDVWTFIHQQHLPYCSLYDEGFTRLGCIGCPLSGRKNMERDFERWPRYKELYIRAFQMMIDRHPGEIRVLKPVEIVNDKVPSEKMGGGTDVSGVRGDQGLAGSGGGDCGMAGVDAWRDNVKTTGTAVLIEPHRGAHMGRRHSKDRGPFRDKNSNDGINMNGGGYVPPGVVDADARLIEVPDEEKAQAILEWWMWVLRPIGPRKYLLIQNAKSAEREATVLHRAMKNDGIRYVMPE